MYKRNVDNFLRKKVFESNFYRKSYVPTGESTKLNIKGISVIVVIISVILVVVLLPIKGGDLPPTIEDQAEIRDEASLERKASLEDIPTIADSADIENEPGRDFYIDENGTKHYIVNVRDVPNFEG